MVTWSPLVGRAAERAAVEAALARCRTGTGGLLLVSGDAGVGKSRLVREVLADWDGRLLFAAATPAAGTYSPLSDVLRTIGEDVGDDALPEAVRPLLAGPATAGGEAGHAADATGLAAAVVRTFRELGRRGETVAVLEDLHWADAAAIELLPALAAALAAEPVLLLAIYRADGLPRAHPIRHMRAEVRHTGHFAELALRPLTAEETGELLAGLLDAAPSPDLVAQMHALAEGLPFFIEELTAALVETGGLRRTASTSGTSTRVTFAQDAELPVPDSVMDAVLLRTERLRRQHRPAVEIAAVLGIRVDLPVLAALVEPQGIDALLESGLLEEEGHGAAVFRHALVREVLYRAIPWARRRGHHQRVAEQLAARSAPPETVAGHWTAAHEHRRARPLLLAAAERLCSVHAYRDAAALARQALDSWPQDVDPDRRTATQERLAECAELCGEPASAVAGWADVARERLSRGDFAGAGSAQRRLANAAGLMGDRSRAAAAREAAAEAFTEAGRRDEAAAEHLALAEQWKSAAYLTKALDQAISAAEDAEAAGCTDLRAHALALQGALIAARGDGQRGVALARSGLALALTGRPGASTAETYYELAEALEYAADYAAAAGVYEAAFELCRGEGDTELARTCFTCTSPVVRLMGDWDRSLAICAETLGDEQAAELLHMVAREETGLIHALRGDPRRARGPLRRAAAFAHAEEVFGMEVGAVWGLSLVAGLEGDEPGAHASVSALLELCRVKEDLHYALPALRWSATFLAGRGDRDGLARCHRVLATAATRNSSSKVLASLAHAGGELALADGDAAQAAEQFGRAVDLLRDVPAPFEKAISQLRRGAALATAGDRETAVSLVTGAYRIARRLGARPLERDCVTALAVMGEQVDRRLGRLAARSLEPAGLTRREKEVLRLLAGGLTNREIAQELFVSPRTVDMHVRHVLAKLGCASRTAAARRAVELGLTDATAEVRR
jgi:DNA-binding CsgD family transcriptional regulator